MDNTLKQNGHPVSSKDISLIAKKHYPKEACDVRTQYSTLFPLSSNKNYRSNSYTRCSRSPHSCGTRQNKVWAEIPVIVITAHSRDEFGSEDIKHFQAFAAGQRPKHILEKPITPASLVKAICKILEVEVDVTKEASEKEAVKSMINDCDPETINKIREMLSKK